MTTDQTTIRRAGPADVAALTSLRREWAEENSGGPIADDGFEYAFVEWYAAEGDSRRAFLAVDDDDNPIGMLNVAILRRMPKPGHAPSCWCYLSNAFVVPHQRNAGVGDRLLDAALKLAREENANRVVVHPSERSVPFYRRAGFSDADELLTYRFE